MIGIYIKRLGKLRDMPEMQNIDGEKSNMRRLIDGKITAIRYSKTLTGRQGNQSFAFIADLSGLEEALGSNPDIASVFTVEQIFGYRKQATVKVQNRIDVDGDGTGDQFTNGFHDELEWATDEDGNRTKVMEDVPYEPEARAFYDACYDRTPYDVTNEDGSVTTITPPVLCGQIMGHKIDHLILD